MVDHTWVNVPDGGPKEEGAVCDECGAYGSEEALQCNRIERIAELTKLKESYIEPDACDPRERGLDYWCETPEGKELEELTKCSCTKIAVDVAGNKFCVECGRKV